MVCPATKLNVLRNKLRDLNHLSLWQVLFSIWQLLSTFARSILELKTLTKFQKLMLINAHPSKLVLNTIGGAIALFYLWKHQILFAILFGGLFIVAGTIITTQFYKFSLDKIADTFFGKIFLRYSTPFGFICYLASHIVIPLSFWLHNLLVSLLGLIILVCGLIKIK